MEKSLTETEALSQKFLISQILIHRPPLKFCDSRRGHSPSLGVICKMRLPYFKGQICVIKNENDCSNKAIGHIRLRSVTQSWPPQCFPKHVQGS